MCGPTPSAYAHPGATLQTRCCVHVYPESHRRSFLSFAISWMKFIFLTLGVRSSAVLQSQPQRLCPPPPARVSQRQGQWCLAHIAVTGMRWLRSPGCWCGERLRPKGWLLITTVLLSILKHMGSRWAGSLRLGEGKGGCCGLEHSEGGDGATETPPRERELLRWAQ